MGERRKTGMIGVYGGEKTGMIGVYGGGKTEMSAYILDGYCLGIY